MDAESNTPTEEEERAEAGEAHVADRAPTEEEERAEAGEAHVADRAPTEEEERSATEARERYADEADSVAQHERSMNERGAQDKGEGRIA